MKSNVASKSVFSRKSIRVIAVIASAGAIAGGAQAAISSGQHHSVAPVRQVIGAQQTSSPSISSGRGTARAHSADTFDPTTSYDPGTDGWTAGDPYAYYTPTDPTTSYDPGTDGWTAGDPYAYDYSSGD